MCYAICNGAACRRLIVRMWPVPVLLETMRMIGHVGNLWPVLCTMQNQALYTASHCRISGKHYSSSLISMADLRTAQRH